MGSQTALNCTLDLARNGVLEKFGVEMIGATEKRRQRPKTAASSKTMEKSACSAPSLFVAHTMEQALTAQARGGLPDHHRPSFTMGGSGGGIAYNKEEFVTICERGF